MSWKPSTSTELVPVRSRHSRRSHSPERRYRSRSRSRNRDRRNRPDRYSRYDRYDRYERRDHRDRHRRSPRRSPYDPHRGYSPDYSYPHGRRGSRHGSDYSEKREPEEEIDTGFLPDGRKRKKANRWGNEANKMHIPGLPTAIVGEMHREKLELYRVYMRLEEINRKLRMGEVIPPDGQRSPSPEPIYGSEGKRTNNRDARYRKRMEDERHALINHATDIDPNFRAPIDYRRPTKCQDKVYIPDREFPEINFIGLLIGPRGNTLKKMESESGAKISIRGRGSVKEGKMPTAADGIEEELHCLVMADAPEKVQRAIKMIEKVIETACSTPESQNELKRQQLRELAALNGTLRDDENQACINCGATGHRRWECPEQLNVTQSLVCRICGTAGHVARDCMQRDNPMMLREAMQRNWTIDKEYVNLMRELGEDVPNVAQVVYGGADGMAGHQWNGMLAAPNPSSIAPWIAQANALPAQAAWYGGSYGADGWGDPSAYWYGTEVAGPPGTEVAPPPPGTY